LTLIITTFIIVAFLIDNWINDTLPVVKFSYIVRLFFSYLGIAIILLPMIGITDFLLVQSAKALFKDFKEADKTGKTIIITVAIVFLLRKIIMLLN
jgi:hypothetical protein